MDGPAASRVEEVFVKAAGLAGEARAAFLARECARDEVLRREVESLLSEQDAEADFLETPPSTVGRRRASDSAADSGSAEEEAGARIGPYRLVGVLGRGGMGTVWLARQEEPVRREVALKIVRAGMDGSEVLARFEAERQALARMDHPNVAHVFDGRATDRGRPYFVMEYVQGPPITEHCDRERLTVKERLALFIQVCEAVQHAHWKGVIHRDLKPSNVLVANVDGRPVPKVIDFGVAKATEGRLTERTLLTMHGEMIGTPEYMSPEAALLGGGAVDTRSDVYSLGVLLYELLTGTLPVDSKTLRSAGPAEMWRLVREAETPRPSTRLRALAAEPTPPAEAGSEDAPPSALGFRAKGAEEVALARRANPPALVRALRGDLDWIAMRALEKDPERRYASVSDLAADLRRHLAHEAVSAGPPGAGYRLRKFVRRNRALVFGVGGVTLSLLAGLVTTAIFYWRAEYLRERDFQARQFGWMATQAYLFTLFNGGVPAGGHSQLANVAGTARYVAESHRDRLRLSGIQIRGWGLSVKGSVAADLGYSHQFLGESLSVLGRTAEALCEHLNSLAVREAEARSLRFTSMGGDAVWTRLRPLAVAHWKVGDALTVMGLPEGALGFYRESMAIHELMEPYEPCSPSFNPVYLGSGHRRIAEALAAMGRSEEALPLLRESLDLVNHGLGIEPENAVLRRDQVLTMKGLGDALLATGRVADAASVLERAVSFAERWNEAAPPANVWERTGLARACLSLGAALAADGRAVDALPFAQRAVALAEALSGADPDNFESRHLLGRGLAELAWHQADAGLATEALVTLEKGMGHLEAVVEKDPDNALARRDLGIALSRAGAASRALASSESSGAGKAGRMRRAQASYARAREVFQSLRGDGRLVEQTSRLLEEVDAEIEGCERALLALANGGEWREASGRR